jgi:hypothetical protein
LSQSIGENPEIAAGRLSSRRGALIRALSDYQFGLPERRAKNRTTYCCYYLAL